MAVRDQDGGPGILQDKGDALGRMRSGSMGDISATGSLRCQGMAVIMCKKLRPGRGLRAYPTPDAEDSAQIMGEAVALSWSSCR